MYIVLLIIATVLSAYSKINILIVVSASALPCALDCAICVSSCAAILKFIGPLCIIFLLFIVFDSTNNYNYIIRYRNGINIAWVLIKKSFMLCVLYMFIITTLLLVAGYFFTGTVCNYSSYYSLFCDELMSTKTPYPVDINPLIFLLKSFTINLLELYAHTLIAVFIYIITSNFFLSSGIFLVIAYYLPGRTVNFSWSYTSEAGFYTELIRNNVYTTNINLLILFCSIFIFISMLAYSRKKNILLK